jgi:hypothetical protein
LLADDALFTQAFPIDEVAAALVQAIRVAPTYQCVVVNVFSYLLLFVQNRSVVLRVFSEFGEQLVLVLALQILSMTRTSAEAVTTICAWLAALVDKYERLAAVAAAIDDPLDIAVCAEFLSPKADRLVLRAVLRLIAALAANQTCAAIFSARREFTSLFGKPAVMADAEICRALLNVTERFTFHDPTCVPEKLVSAIPALLQSDIGVQRSVLRILCQTAIPEHLFLIGETIPEIVAGFMESADSTLCWLAIRTITQFIAVFHIDAAFFRELRGKERVFELLGRQQLCRAVLIALAGLLQICPRFGDDDRLEIVTLIRQFEGFAAVKHLADLVDAWTCCKECV